MGAGAEQGERKARYRSNLSGKFMRFMDNFFGDLRKDAKRP
jgi:hypothetical protein